MALAGGLSAVLGIIGTAVSAAGTIQAGRAEAARARYQADIARRNKEIALQNAERLRQRSQTLQEDQDIQTRALIGEQIAVQSASGLSLGGKSQLLTRKSARRLGRLDALNIRQAGEVDAYNSEVEAFNFGAQANLLEAEAKNSRTASYLNATSSLIGGARSVLNDFNFNKQRKGLLAT